MPRYSGPSKKLSYSCSAVRLLRIFFLAEVHFFLAPAQEINELFDLSSDRWSIPYSDGQGHCTLRRIAFMHARSFSILFLFSGCLIRCATSAATRIWRRDILRRFPE